jgi:hypothetical protein
MPAVSTVPVADQQARESPPPAGFTGSKGALMCTQPHNPEQANDNRADVPAPVKQEQGSPSNAPSGQPRPRVAAGRAGRNVVVRGVRRDPPTIRNLARVVASLAADLVENETGEQPPLAEPDSSGANDRNLRGHAA